MIDTIGDDENKNKEFEKIIYNIDPIKNEVSYSANLPESSAINPDFEIQNITFGFEPSDVNDLNETPNFEVGEISRKDTNLLNSDELCDLVAEIEKGDNTKQLADDELNNITFDLSNDLFNDEMLNNNNEDIEDEIIKNTEIKVRNLNPIDRKKTMELLKQNCDNDKKKNIYDKLVKQLKYHNF